MPLAVRHNARVAGGLVLIVVPELGKSISYHKTTTCSLWKQALESLDMPVRLLSSDASASAAAKSHALLLKGGGITVLCMLNDFASFDKIYTAHNSFNKREKILLCITRFFAVEEFCHSLKHMPRIQFLDVDALLMKPNIYEGTAPATDLEAFGSLTTSFSASYIWQADCTVFQEFKRFVTKLYTGPQEHLVSAINTESHHYYPKLANGTIDYEHGVESRFGRHSIGKGMPSHFKWLEFSDMHIYAMFLTRPGTCAVCDKHNLLNERLDRVERYCQQDCAAKDVLHSHVVKVVGIPPGLRYSVGIRQANFPGKKYPCEMEADVEHTSSVVHFQGACKKNIKKFISAFSYGKR